MNCAEARLQIGAQPSAPSTELAAHVNQCAACAEFFAQMAALEQKIGLVLAAPPRLVRESASPRIAVPDLAKAAASRARAPRWALAAGVLLMLCVAGTVWTLWPSASLAADVVAHMSGEPNSWTSEEHVDGGTVNDILRSSGVMLVPGAADVGYAHRCWFRGHYVPHLVVRTGRGPVTVLILRHERVSAPEPIESSRFSGTIVPTQYGALAVLARGEMDVREAAAVLQASLRWFPEPP